MSEWLTLLIFLLAYTLVMRWILPRLGHPA